MHSSIGGITLHGRPLCETDGTACDRSFRQVSMFCNPLDNVTVSIACRKVHFAVRFTGIFAQDHFNSAPRFDEVPPVCRSKKSEAADAIAHGNLIGRLLLVFRLNQLFDRQARLCQSLLNPCQWQCQGGTLSLHATSKLGDKRT